MQAAMVFERIYTSKAVKRLNINLNLITNCYIYSLIRNQFEVRISKKGYEFFGWKFVGGNQIGIFVHSVENWSPAFKANIKPGWKLIEVKSRGKISKLSEICLNEQLLLRNQINITQGVALLI